MILGSYQNVDRSFRCKALASFSACLFAFLLAGCMDRSSKAVIEPSTIVPFEDAFTFVDTLVLDSSVIVGPIWFMDSDASGNVLITDMTAGLTHLFSNTGMHQVTYNMDTCFPTDDGHRVWASRFADGDRIISGTTKGAMVVFDRSGKCLAAKQLLTRIRSFCSRGDSIFSFRGPEGMDLPGTSKVGVYSMDLELNREIILDDPRFYRLNVSFTGLPGRDMECFQNGPYFKYHEDMDARPVRRHSHSYMSKPEFFVKRDQDIPSARHRAERNESMYAYSLLSGLYALDEDIRMTQFSRIGEKFRPDSVTDRFLTGLSIVSNSNQFKGISTMPPKGFHTARHGHLYFVGDNVVMADGDVGNPTVIRYKFNPPEAVDD